jgi:hypothetical protein
MMVMPMMAGQSVWSVAGRWYEKEGRRARWRKDDIVME